MPRGPRDGDRDRGSFIHAVKKRTDGSCRSNAQTAQHWCQVGYKSQSNIIIDDTSKDAKTVLFCGVLFEQQGGLRYSCKSEML